MAENVSSGKVAATSGFYLPAAAFWEPAAGVGVQVGGGVTLGEGPEGRGVTAAVITPIKFKWPVLLLPLPPPTCIVVSERAGVLAAAAAAPPT